MKMASEVKWIKIVTDIFDDEKIILIESMPEADAIIVIWFKLLCLAGKTNTLGVMLLNDRIPYNDEMLAQIFRRPLNTVRLALTTFEKYGMIEIINGAITIPNWEKHQQLEKLENSREQTKKRVAAYRERQKKLLGTGEKGECNALQPVTVTQSNADRIREEEEKNKNTTTPTPSPPLHPDDDDDFHRIQQEHDLILDAAENAGFPKNQATYDKIIALYADFGKDAVLDGISACVDQGKTVISYLKACVKRIAEEKKKAEPDEPYMDENHEFWGWGQ